MPENRAHKLNKQKQPAPTEGKFLYYFHNHGILTSAEVTEEQFDKLVSLDTAFYNNDRRAVGKVQTKPAYKQGRIAEISNEKRQSLYL